MSENQNQKVRLMKLYDTLINKTSEDHKLSTGELMQKLKEQGFSSTRKTFYNDIETLKNAGYEIITHSENGKSNKYCILNASFDNAEIKILIDAVQSASFLTKSKTEKLIEKISRINGKVQSDGFLKNIISFGEIKSTNAKLYYYIDTINEAITNNKKISFQYTTYNEKADEVYRKDGERYVGNPVMLVFENSKYYMLSHEDGQPQLKTYRIDRMDDVRYEEKSFAKPKDVALKVADMKKQMFSMYQGEKIDCVIEIEKYMIDIMIDQFGKGIIFQPQENGKLRFKVTVQESPAFVSWCIKFGADVKVLEPASALEKIKILLEKINENYL